MHFKYFWMNNYIWYPCLLHTQRINGCINWCRYSLTFVSSSQFKMLQKRISLTQCWWWKDKLWMGIISNLIISYLKFGLHSIISLKEAHNIKRDNCSGKCSKIYPLKCLHWMICKNGYNNSFPKIPICNVALLSHPVIIAIKFLTLSFVLIL